MDFESPRRARAAATDGVIIWANQAEKLAERVRDNLGSACRMFALTGYGQEHDKQRSHEAGFEAHLVKPVDPAGVLGLIDGPARACAEP